MHEDVGCADFEKDQIEDGVCVGRGVVCDEPRKGDDCADEARGGWKEREDVGGYRALVREGECVHVDENGDIEEDKDKRGLDKGDDAGVLFVDGHDNADDVMGGSNNSRLAHEQVAVWGYDIQEPDQEEEHGHCGVVCGIHVPGGLAEDAQGDGYVQAEEYAHG